MLQALNVRHVMLAALAACSLVSASAFAQGPSPKAPSVTRIGIVQPRVQMGGADAAQAAESMRDILAGYLQGPTIEVAFLSSRLPSQYQIEAQRADCDFILATTLTHRRGSDSGGSGKLFGALAGQLPHIPGSDYTKTAIVTTVLQSAEDFAANVRARDDMQLVVKLESTGNKKPLLEKTTKRKAKSDGEDLLTPLVEGAAEAVGGAIAAASP